MDSKIYETTLEINLKHLTHNFEFIKTKIDSHVKTLCVVKAMGYGSDYIIVSKHLEELGVDYLAVAFSSEGVLLREAGIRLPILVLYPQPGNFAKILSI